MKGKENQKSDEAAASEKTESEQATEAARHGDFSSELNAPQWSVVSFETCLANSLTYDEAAKKLERLTAEKVAGLCIVTDEAAGRIKN